MMTIKYLTKREFYMLKMNAVIRQPSIEEIARVTGRDELELYDLVKDIQLAIVDNFTPKEKVDYKMHVELKKVYLLALKKDKEKEQALRKLRYMEWREKSLLP